MRKIFLGSGRPPRSLQDERRLQARSEGGIHFRIATQNKRVPEHHITLRSGVALEGFCQAGHASMAGFQLSSFCSIQVMAASSGSISSISTILAISAISGLVNETFCRTQ